ncbi:MAG: hypothetical protein HUJ26_08465 [Planctomycetaceae bacterium]|nr:hypothetical protein [Planctomycetaceae bacterium]
MAARPSEDDETDRLTVWFGPPSRKRNLWMFVGTTGTVGLILALILLFQTNPPEDVQIAMSKKKAEEKKVVEETPEPEPDPEPTIVAKVEPEPEPDPEPEITPEPTPPPVEDQFDVQVILLPGPPEKNQGEQFEVTGEEEPIIPDDGFDLVTTHWQESALLDLPNVDPWAELQKLVPLEPFGPRDYVLDPIPGGAVTASFLTTQPRRGTQSLLMPYEMSLTNTGASKIDRVVLEQSLPASIELRETSAVHAAEDRTLRWEYENLSPQEQWRVPMVVVPTLQGQVSLPTTIEVGRVASAKTLVQRPDIELSLTCEPAAQYKKYHQIVFLMKNTGEVPLHNLLMDVQLTGNLSHRFGQDFEFFEEQLDVGQTRRALLHVKTEDLGGANLQASLVTDEGAEAAGQCEFAIVGNGEIEARGVESSPREPGKDEFQQPAPLAEEESRTWRERKGTAKEKPDFSSESSESSFARPNRAPRTLQAAEEAATDRKPPEKESAPPSKPETVEEFPEFPGFEPLPERKSASEPSETKNESVTEPSFDPPPKQDDAAKDSDSPAEDPFAPMETEEDPFAPSKKEDGFFE